ncbi:isocitrate lyase/PEP mutase family protein [Haloglycomyces albus]|uniref:isocitrate lyase/PEP mutase family protein n=1 Tax=Haloglycomyces albus TaxID=526067 RepID=UPI00046C97A9|nr:isocitrate lyase/phosphoenolpyruvate mutase family protein [Haloglycomyces albus]
MDNITAKAEAFRRLHTQSDPFLIPNPHDAGTARILASLDYPALATTSSGLAASLGVNDREGVTVDHCLRNATEIAAATDLPVSVDFEDGFGTTAADVRTNVATLATTGVVGCSIEDSTGDPSAPIRPLEEAIDRIRAALEAVAELNFPFTVTARAENFLCDENDLADTVKRLQAYASAGAHVVYAPGLPNADAVRTVCQAVDVPVNALLGVGNNLSARELFDLGVHRVSLGGALSTVAMDAFQRAATEVAETGKAPTANPESS